MTPFGENLYSSEVKRLMPFLTPRATTNMGTMNVRTIWKTGRTNQIAVRIRRHYLTVLGISETNLTQAVQKRLDLREMLLYSDHEEENAVAHSRSCSDSI